MKHRWRAAVRPKCGPKREFNLTIVATATLVRAGRAGSKEARLRNFEVEQNPPAPFVRGDARARRRRGPPQKFSIR
ncbi:hypothetical protein EVAR_46070_1 [Eumeta japonica]|uniref:Uncharacterized protein n=1 Tax=Eumeta variegata TaxID=151549 RepID=A0A4C1SP07_EUMVA|nr:hypothetical protein EVAR_46070_1 [Eumeta japonica]